VSRGINAILLSEPNAQKNLDPEALEEFKEQQSKMSGIQSALQSGDLKAGYAFSTMSSFYDILKLFIGSLPSWLQEKTKGIRPIKPGALLDKFAVIIGKRNDDNCCWFIYIYTLCSTYKTITT